MRILDSIDGFEGRSRFTTWAMKIAVNVALTELRRKRWRNVSLDQIVEAAGEGAGPVASEEGPHVAAERSDVMAWLQRIMKEELTDRQRTAISAVAFGGMSLTEVATRMNTNRNALYKVMHDGRLRLKRRLEREGTSESEIIDDLERKR